MNNMDEELARFLYDNKKSEFWRDEYWSNTSSKDFMFNTSVWAYAGLTLGAVMIDSRKWTLKGAITGKMNFGLSNTYMYSKDLYLNFSGSNLLYDANTTAKLQYASPFIVNNEFVTNKLKFGTSNTGWGMDAGLIVEKKDKND